MGYAQPGTNPLELVELAQEAERLGYDSAWAAEAWGTDAVSVLSWLAATTTTLKIGSAILQIPGRTPANAAMTAATLDLLSGGRFLLGLGTSGPQVVEGWHGEPWGKPLTKTREYVEIVRTVLRREQLDDAIAAAADFAVAPVLDHDLIGAALERGVPFIPGALTPTEIASAWEAGATFVKLFPASAVGPALVRELRGPLPDVELIPTGGIDAANAQAFLAAGAAAVGVGSAIVRATPDERAALVRSLSVGGAS